MLFPEEMRARLNHCGYKATPQRIAVLRAIADSKGHLTPTTLYQKVRDEQPNIGLVTVYRTLNVLAEVGLICKVHTGENARGYVRSPLEHHGHIICSDCGKVIDFTGCDLNALEQRLARETGFAIEGHLLEFFGCCRDCRKSAIT